jgi:membrane-associated phospholipid phosphatase
LDTLVKSYLKLAYHNPRPFMIEPNITPLKCSSSFGNPSGHSTGSALFAIVVFLDVFHGKNNKYHKSTIYYVSLILAAYWAVSIPYTRLVIGVHSLDQVLYGSTIDVNIIISSLRKNNFTKN